MEMLVPMMPQSPYATVMAAVPFNPESDCHILHKAMKGIGTDEAAIVGILTHRTSFQREQLRMMYKTIYAKDLEKQLGKELSGNFKATMHALLLAPAELDANELHRAMAGAGTKERVLLEIFCTRHSVRIKEIAAVYHRLHKKTLESALKSESSGHFKHLLVALSEASRADDAPFIDMAMALADATALYRAGEKKLGTDESVFISILSTRSYSQLRATFDEYKKITGHDMEHAIKSEMSGELEDGMLAIVACVRNTPGYLASVLHHALAGAGTKDHDLIRVVVSRCEFDMQLIKEQYHALYKKSLGEAIKGDTSGDYRHALLALIGE